MACTASFSGHSAPQLGKSPFSLHPADAAKISACERFQSIRQQLARARRQSFCLSHHSPDTQTTESWLLHRDIIHALLLPIIQIFRSAAAVAESATCSRRPEDLEMAYKGEARSAFLWLQCFLADDEDWCTTQGCPACIVDYTLHSEPTIRLLLASCLLSAASELEQPTTSPTLSVWLHPIRSALEKDPFWGPGTYQEIERRAENLVGSIRQLVEQCRELEAIVASPRVKAAAQHPPRLPQMVLEQAAEMMA